MADYFTPMPMIRTRFFDDNGRPLSGGKVYTYEPNTTTPKTTYKDLAATTPNTNPILLDVAGEADIYFDGKYRVIVESWRGEKLYDVDNIGALAQIGAQFILDASGKTQQKVNDELKTASPYSANNYATIQTAVNNSALGNTVEVNTGAYSQSVDLPKLNLQGKGYGTEISVASNSYGIKSLQTSPNWDRMRILDIAFKGQSLINTIGFQFDPADAFAGRRNIEYCTFDNLDIAIYKPKGNIGNVYRSVSISNSNYGYRAKSSETPLMHAGNDKFEDAQFNGILKWSVDLENTSGSDGFGQFEIDNSIFQFSEGGGIRINLAGIVPICPPTIRNVWFEEIASAASVDRDGVSETPREIKLINTPMCIIEGSYLKNIELINSTAIAKYCRIDNANQGLSFVLDSNSQLILEDAYLDGYAPPNITFKSIAKQKRTLPAPLTVSGQPINGITKKPYGAFSAVGLPFFGTQGASEWYIYGSQTLVATCVYDDGVKGTCAELNTNTGITSVIKVTTLTAGKWAVWGISLKAVSATGGVFKFKNDTYEIGDIYVQTGKWTHNFGVAKVGTGGDVAAWFAPDRATTLRFANYFVVQFDTEAEAIAFANSRMAVDTVEREVAVTYDPPSLAAGALQTTTVTLSGVRVGEAISVSFNRPLQGTSMWADVTAADTVTVYHKNESASAVDLASGTLRVKLI